MEDNKKGRTQGAPIISLIPNSIQRVCPAPQDTGHRRRQPAYGKIWVEARRKGMVPQAGSFDALVLLDHWEIEPAWPRLVIPGDTDPIHLDFRVLIGRDVTLAYWSHLSSDDRLLSAFDAIIRDGAKVVVTLDRAVKDRAIIRRRAV